MSTYSTCLITSDTDQSLNGYDGYNFYIIDASSNNIDFTLTANYVSNGLYYYFIRVDGSTNQVTLTAPSGYTINNTSTISLGINQTCEIIFNNNNWLCPKYTYN
jgi:hypothetical protein